MYLDAQKAFLLGDALAFPHPLLSDFPGDWPEISENLREISEISDAVAGILAGAEPSDWADPRTFPVELPGDTCRLSLSSRWDVTALLDRQDYEWARRFTWYPTYGSGKMVLYAPGVYAIQNPDHIYARTTIDGRQVWLHRAVLGRAAGPPRYKRAIGDHCNGQTLDCRRANLRWATIAMNNRNRPGSKVRKRLCRAAA